MSEWKRVKLRDCVEEVNERTTENNQYEVLTSSKSGIYSQEDYFDKQVASKDNTGYKIIKKGQFTYRSMSDNGTFTINRLENRDIGIVSPAYPVFEAISINPEYLKYFFQSEGFRKEIYNLSQGSTRTALKYKDLSNIEILLPTIEEQERIVRILTNIDEVLRNYEKNNNEQINYMNYIMKKTLDKKEDMIKLREIGEIITGNTPKTTEKDNYGEEYNWVTPGDMGISKYITNTERKLSLKGFEKSRKVNKGSILVTCIGSTIGKIGIAGKECSTNQQINSINLFNNINNEYVYYAIKYNFKYFTDYISNQAVPIINKTVFGNLQIPNISLSRQKKIAITLKILDKKIECNKKIIDEYKKLKKALMQKLLTGKVRVKI